ncbi:MAG: flagellar biosynthesis protein FlhF [Hahellaceae bacterium]|jgi:flagellar biosynthesis protein FlhF|nr:flagellar biosynthesis protein FlhF [Hahellaceae bacterium]
MGMKRYLAANMQQALRQIREELGADAVILSTQKTAAGVEVICSVDEPVVETPAVAASPATPRTSPLRATDTPRVSEKPRVVASGDSDAMLKQKRENDRAMQAMRDEISQLRSLISEIPRRSDAPKAVVMEKPTVTRIETAVPATASPAGNVFRQRLAEMGLESDLSERLLTPVAGKADEKSWQWVMGGLCKQVPVLADELIDVPGAILFLGATGAGKTTTIAKLAARYVLKHGADSLALVTTDRFRMGGAQQLQMLGRLLRVPVVAIEGKDALDDVLDRLSDKKLVLVDTAGMTPSDASWAEQNALLTTRRHRVRRCLVVPATSQLQVIKASYKAFKAGGVQACIISKIDEAVSLGEAISLLVSERLPLAYVGDGQQIAANIHRFNARTLVMRLMKMWQDNQSDKHFTGEKAQYGQDLVI